MKKNPARTSLLFPALLLLCLSTIAQTSISNLPLYSGNPAGGWVPIVISNTTRKVDAASFALGKVDSVKYHLDSLANAALLALKVGSAKYATDSAATVSAIAAKVKYTDTAAMLSTYAKSNKVKQDSIDLRAAIPTNNNQLTNGANYITSSGAPVQTVAGRTGAVVIGESDVTNLTADLSGKQATLVSGTNIKTINSTSLLGSGNIVITGGGTDTAHIAGFGLLKSISGAVVTDKVDTSLIHTSVYNKKITDSIGGLKVNYTDTASMLSHYIRNSFWNVDGTGNLVPTTDNTYNIGTKGTGRLKYGFIGDVRIGYNAPGQLDTESGNPIYLAGNGTQVGSFLRFDGYDFGHPLLKGVGATLVLQTADQAGYTGFKSLYERFGTGTPEGNETAPVGAVYHRTDGGAGTSFYVKESGTGNTGWVAK